MMRGFYTARTGMLHHQFHMDVVANNLANVNTVGFRASKVSFTDLMYQNLNRNTADDTAMVGHGVRINKTDLVMTSGAPTPTGFTFDFAIIHPHNGFFALQDANDNITYTRAGNFIMSQEEGGGIFFLAAPNGDRVLDADGEPVEVIVDEDGAHVDIGDIGIFTFSNPYGLHTIGGSRFVPSDNSGEAEAFEEGGRLLQGHIESSNVEFAAEMVKVIESQRAFVFNSRIIQTADELAQTVNSMR